MPRQQESKLTKKEQIKLACERDFFTFVKVVAPYRVWGSIHFEIGDFLTGSKASTHQLVLIPRAHLKSTIAAFYSAWRITKNPAITILYLSSTAGLAEKQLASIKNILISDKYRRYWPEMCSPDEGKRAKWTNSEIQVDHPKRRAEGVRDSTVFTAGLTTSITGFHCDLTIGDDIVVQENAYTEDGRAKVRTQFSLIASIENPDAEQKIFGTRYHPKDLYGDLLAMTQEIYNEDGDIVDLQKIYQIFEREVENYGDGTGEFLWPRQQRKDGAWFGFNANVLAKKRGQYLDRMQYRAQYYNDPNDPDNLRISQDLFQYYKREHIKEIDGFWHYKDTRLNVFAAIDFAFTLSKKADHSCVVVIGVDDQRNIFVLDIDRFKTELISEYFKHILTMHNKWSFRKLRAEVTVAQKAIVKDLKESYIKPHGLKLSIAEFNPTRHQGTKEERVKAVIEPRYENQQVWHYKGGNCQTLEEELVMQNPPHDDIKDTLASAIEIAVPPQKWFGGHKNSLGSSNVIYNTRFGGVSHVAN